MVSGTGAANPIEFEGLTNVAPCGNGMNLMLVTRVVKRRKAFQAKAHTSCYRTDPPNDLMIVRRRIDQAPSLDRHKIDQFGNSVGAIKPGNQNIGIGR